MQRWSERGFLARGRWQSITPRTSASAVRGDASSHARILTSSTARRWSASSRCGGCARTPSTTPACASTPSGRRSLTMSVPTFRNYCSARQTTTSSSARHTRSRWGTGPRQASRRGGSLVVYVRRAIAARAGCPGIGTSKQVTSCWLRGAVGRRSSHIQSCHGPSPSTHRSYANSSGEGCAMWCCCRLASSCISITVSASTSKRSTALATATRCATP
mmetsp:Transcript_51016/g.141206  ORF Transcript_51016/g.141206 Transcript_51016/m.141206 type:complete len:217 (-) Transcript_51016:172-822(-)